MKVTATLAPTIDNGQKTAKNEKPFVSVVVPAYNESAIIEKNLGVLCEYMESLSNKFRWELIVVNDGSTDQTGDLAEAFARDKKNVHVLHHMYNFRLGQALRFAFSKCRGEYVVVIDADLSYSPDHIGKMLTKIRETRAKIVIASPYMKGGKVSNVPWLRKMFSIWANRFLSLTAARDSFSDKLRTLTGMVRAYDGKFLSKLNLKAMDVDIMPEIIYKAMILRARIVEVPAHLNWSSHKDDGKRRKSSMRIFKSIISSFLSGFTFRPFMFFIIPGLGLAILSLYPITWAIIHTVVSFKNLPTSGQFVDAGFSAAVRIAFSQSPHSFLLGGLSLIIGIQLISLGTIALQNKKYFEELFHLSSSLTGSNRKNNTH
jgi:glycosyltransferase involved in cell wall biosynthesis